MDDKELMEELKKLVIKYDMHRKIIKRNNIVSETYRNWLTNDANPNLQTILDMLEYTNLGLFIVGNGDIKTYHASNYWAFIGHEILYFDLVSGIEKTRVQNAWNVHSNIGGLTRVKNAFKYMQIAGYKFELREV